MMTEREFWIQFRRGLITAVAAVSDGAPRQPFWSEVADGLSMIVRAIDERYNLPPSARIPSGEGVILGTFTPKEPPVKPFARTHPTNGAAS